MKHIQSPQSRTLGLVIGTALLLLVASFLILQINDSYIREEGQWVDRQIQKSPAKQLAILKTPDEELVRGDVRRSENGERSLLTVEITDLAAPSGNNFYSVYFGKESDPSDALFVAQLGQPQEIDGVSKYILTGWGPVTWSGYDKVEIRSGNGSAQSHVVLAGSFEADK